MSYSYLLLSIDLYLLKPSYPYVVFPIPGYEISLYSRLGVGPTGAIEFEKRFISSKLDLSNNTFLDIRVKSFLAICLEPKVLEDSGSPLCPRFNKTENLWLRFS